MKRYAPWKGRGGHVPACGQVVCQAAADRPSWVNGMAPCQGIPARQIGPRPHHRDDDFRSCAGVVVADLFHNDGVVAPLVCRGFFFGLGGGADGHPRHTAVVGHDENFPWKQLNQATVSVPLNSAVPCMSGQPGGQITRLADRRPRMRLLQLVSSGQRAQQALWLAALIT